MEKSRELFEPLLESDEEKDPIDRSPQGENFFVSPPPLESPLTLFGRSLRQSVPQYAHDLNSSATAALGDFPVAVIFMMTLVGMSALAGVVGSKIGFPPRYDQTNITSPGVGAGIAVGYTFGLFCLLALCPVLIGSCRRSVASTREQVTEQRIMNEVAELFNPNLQEIASAYIHPASSP